jgi:hypothetical protein
MATHERKIGGEEDPEEEGVREGIKVLLLGLQREIGESPSF